MFLLNNSKSTVAILALLVALSGESFSTEKGCSLDKMIEIERYYSFAEALFPFTTYQMEKQKEVCIEDNGQIVSYSFFITYKLDNLDFLSFIEIKKSYDGGHFWDSEEMSIFIRFLDPKTDLDQHERILGTLLPGAQVYNYSKKTKNGKPIKPYKKKQTIKDKKEDKKGSEAKDAKGGESKAKKSDAEQKKEQEILQMKEQLELEKAKVQKEKFKKNKQTSVVSSDILDEPKAGFHRGTNLSMKKKKGLDALVEIPYINKHTLDVPKFILQNKLKPYLMNMFVKTIVYSKLFDPEEITFMNSDNIEHFVYTQSENKEYFEFQPFDELIHENLSKFEVIGARMHKFDEEGVFDKPVGYKMKFNYIWEEVSTFEDEYGHGVRLSFSIETPQDYKDELNSVKDLLWPIPHDHMERAADTKSNEMRGISFQVNAAEELLEFGYFLIFSNNTLSPNNSINARFSLTSMFESWFQFRQDTSSDWIPIESASLKNDSFGVESVLSLELVIRNFLQQSLYCGEIFKVDSKSHEIYRKSLMEVIDFKLRKSGGAWGPFEGVEVERPEIPFNLVRHSFVFKLEINDQLVKKWLAQNEQVKSASFALHSDSEQHLKNYQKILDKIICIGSVEFELRDRNEPVLKGLSEKDLYEFYHQKETISKFTLLKVSCKNLNKNKLIELPKWMVNEIDIIYDLYNEQNKKPKLRNDTFHGLV